MGNVTKVIYLCEARHNEYRFNVADGNSFINDGLTILGKAVTDLPSTIMPVYKFSKRLRIDVVDEHTKFVLVLFYQNGEAGYNILYTSKRPSKREISKLIRETMIFYQGEVYGMNKLPKVMEKEETKALRDLLSEVKTDTH